MTSPIESSVRGLQRGAAVAAGPARRRCAAWPLLLVGLLACGGARGRAASGAAVDGDVPGRAVPSWLPPYTAAQQALLAPVKEPIQVPARRVFPDLERFGYANNRRVADPLETVKFTRMVATVLQDSPRFYFLDKTGPENANLIAQYGPTGAPEPDGWHVVVRDESGIGRMVRAPLAPESQRAFEKGVAAQTANDLGGAAAQFTAAIEKSPQVPALRVALGDVLAVQGDTARARTAYQAAVGIDTTYSAAHRGLAETALKGGDVAAAKREAALALAWHPPSKRALAVADAVSFGAATAGNGRVQPMKIFIDVDAIGAIHVLSDGTNPGQMYASCRAVMRWEPDVRAAIFEQPPETPYYLSVIEEVVCLESAIGAYIFDQAEQRGANEMRGALPLSPGGRSGFAGVRPAMPEAWLRRAQAAESANDTAMEALFRMAQKDGLSGYALFEILGQHRPERVRMAPEEVHRAVLDYVEQYVIGGASSLPTGTFTAQVSAPASGPPL
ncbi:MAG: tetratricopeptide repeat protein [Polyangiaceae bacterium]